MSERSIKSLKPKPIDAPFDRAILQCAREVAGEYRIMLEQTPEGFEGTVLEMDTIFGFGESADACVKQTLELLVTALAVMLEDGESLPAPATDANRTEQVNLRISPLEKRDLHRAARREGFRGVSDFVRSASIQAARAGTNVRKRKLSR